MKEDHTEEREIYYDDPIVNDHGVAGSWLEKPSWEGQMNALLERKT